MGEQQQELEKIEKIMVKPDFWQKDQEEIARLNQLRASLKDTIDQWNQYYRETEDAKILAEMAHEEDDRHMLNEVGEDVIRIEKDVTFENKNLSDRYYTYTILNVRFVFQHACKK